jgi:hypothetical protein
MTSPPTEHAAPLDLDSLGEDWFGEGTAFESGEELAAALFAMAAAGSGTAPRPAAAAPAVTAAPPSPPPAGPRDAGSAPSPPVLIGEFQVAAMPSFEARSAEPSRGPHPSGWARDLAPLKRPPRSGWSIRQSVAVLRTTEEILIRLREEAAELTWRLAAEVCAEVDG